MSKISLTHYFDVGTKVLPRPLKHRRTQGGLYAPVTPAPPKEVRYYPEKATAKPEIVVQRGYHWLIGGIPGIGKTFASTAIIKNILDGEDVDTYILDMKNQGDFDRYRHAIHYSGEKHPGLLNEQSPEHTLIWHVTIDNLQEVDAWLKAIRERGKKANVLIDELGLIVPSNIKKTPPNYALLAKLGRLPKITMLSGTQDLAGLPRQALGLATHVVMMQITNKHDKGVARDLMEQEKYLTFPHEHGLWYKNVKKNIPARYFASIQQFLYK